MRKPLLALALTGLVALSAPIGAQADAEEIVLADDPAGDWGQATDPALGDLGGPLSQDLVGASVVPDYEAGTMSFRIYVTELPEIGGIPEFTRYVWDADVDGKLVELDGKFTNYSRGTCDPTSGSCPPPRDPGLAPFVVRGNCTTTQSVTTCQELGKVEATFDPTTDSITVPVPIALLDPNATCPTLRTGTNIFGGFLSASPSAFFTSSALPMDFMEDFYFLSVPTCAPEAE